MNASLMKVFLFALGLTTSQGFLSYVHTSSAMTTRTKTFLPAFEQQQGESDIDFIKRITSAPLNQQNSTVQARKKKIKGKYQRIEEWDAERKVNGELSWEERVQFEGQAFGNQVRQNDILIRNLHSF